jgi:hypothetical protein
MAEIMTSVNVQQAVPFFRVTNMDASLRFYVETTTKRGLTAAGAATRV